MGRGWFGVVKFRIAKFIQPEKNCGDRAVLVAISIPIFSSQLEKSRDAVSISNIRAAYAEAASAYMTANGNAVAKSGNVTVAAGQTSGTETTQDVTVDNVLLKGQNNGWSGLDAELSFTHTALTADMGAYHDAKGYAIVFTFSTDGSCTLKSVTVENN